MILNVKELRVDGVLHGWETTLEGGKKMSVPNDSANTQCKKVQDWLALGNTPLPADVSPVPTYTQLRATAYASQGEQLDMQYHDLVNGTTTWIDHITAIKTKYPKV